MRYFVPQSGVEKIIINTVDNDHDMQDTVVLVTGPWEAESEDERGAIPVIWNLGPSLVGALLTADIDRYHRNWSCLLDPNCPPGPLVFPGVSASGKS